MPVKAERELRRTRPQYQWGAECACGEQVEIRADRPVVILELSAAWGRMHQGCPGPAPAGGEGASYA